MADGGGEMAKTGSVGTSLADSDVSLNQPLYLMGEYRV